MMDYRFRFQDQLQEVVDELAELDYSDARGILYANGKVLGYLTAFEFGNDSERIDPAGLNIEKLTFVGKSVEPAEYKAEGTLELTRKVFAPDSWYHAMADVEAGSQIQAGLPGLFELVYDPFMHCMTYVRKGNARKG